ncbi:MAG: integrase arm-type DNA-binding domain-containing protein [Terracidiphilus sp.]|jgi:integrase
MAGLTDTGIKRAKTTERAYSMGDGGGLYLWVKPTGGKLWRWSYRFEGKEKLMSFGKYPDISLALARDRHAEARRLLATGIDPMAQRKIEKKVQKVSSENSFQSVYARWLEYWQEGKSPRHVDSVRRRMAADILPCLGARPIARIEAPELVAMANAIQDRGARDIAKRALETVGQVFRYGIAHGLATRNPATEIRPSDILKSIPKTNYARIDAKELPTLLRRIEVYQGKQVTRLAMKLMAMTFVRTTELIEAKWTEFDLENSRWDIPTERMKMRTPHIVPLARQALEVLEMLRELTGSGEWLFPGDFNAAQPMSNNTILKALERMGYKGRMTGHGFRGLASTMLHEQGYLHDHIELQLAHAPRNAVSAAYNHALYLEPRVRMMQDWADFLERTQRGGKVLPFRPTAA